MINHNALNTVIDTMNSTTDVIAEVYLTTEQLTVIVLTSDEYGEIEEQQFMFLDNGTVLLNDRAVQRSILRELSQPVRTVIQFLLVAFRDGVVHGDNPELELIADNRQFFLDNEAAFVPATVLEAAGIVDEHNDPVVQENEYPKVIISTPDNPFRPLTEAEKVDMDELERELFSPSK